MLNLDPVSIGFRRLIDRLTTAVAQARRGSIRSNGMIPSFLRPRNRFHPHQGLQERARRRRQIAAGTLQLPCIKPRARIENWAVVRLGGKERLHGNVYGHRSAADGTAVNSSEIVNAHDYGAVIETRNTFYTLGRPA